MKKFLSIILSICMIIIMLSGCGKNSKAEDEQTNPKEKKVQLNVTVKQHPLVKDFNTNKFTLWLEKQLNVDLNVTPVQNSSWNDKIGIMMSTGDYPEIIIGREFPNVILYGMQENLLLPLNDLIDEHAANIKKADKEIPGLINSMKQADGNIYSINGVQENFHATYPKKMWYYAPFLEKIGVEPPATIEEFYDVLRRIKKEDPNENNESDEIPLMCYEEDDGLAYICNSFLYTQLSPIEGVSYYLENDKIETPVNKAQMREAISFVSKLYKEGLLYSNSFNQKRQQAKALTESSEEPIVGFVPALFSGEFTTIGEEKYRDFKPLPPVKGANGVQYSNTVKIVSMQDCFVITDRLPEEKREHAIKLADIFFTHEATLRSKWGRLGTDWEWAKDGEVGIDGNKAVFKSHTGWNPKLFGNENVSWINFHLYYEPARLRLTLASDPDVDIYSAKGLEKYLYQTTKNMYEKYGAAEKFLPPLKLTADEADEEAQYTTDLDKFVSESVVKFITGETDINNDNDWQKYIDGIDRLKLEKLLKINQAAYDRIYK